MEELENLLGSTSLMGCGLFRLQFIQTVES